MKFLILGDGILAKEIIKQTGWEYVSRKKHNFDITKSDMYNNFFIENFEGMNFTRKYDCIINCIAHTDTYSLNKNLHWEVNYKSLYKLIIFCNIWDIKLVHISTDYIFANCIKEEPTEDDVPVHSENWYSYTKLLGDSLVQLLSKNYLLCRCTHKEYPFPFKKVFADRVGNFDYTPKIAELIIDLVKLNAEGVYNVGTNKKTMKELVEKENPNIEFINTPEGFPKKTSMSIDKLKNFLYIS